MMFARFRSFALMTALLAGVIAFPLAAGAQPQAPAGVTVPVTGTAANGSTFSGAYTITHFVGHGNSLLAQGTLSGILTNPTTGATQSVTNVPVQVPVTAADPTCTILDLTLGPLDLNLLGLMVHLNTVHLTITAQSGPGNLLGNLLCAVANLLNGGAPLGALSGLLNRILAIL
ncbi:MAG: hypothetical protein JOZ81_11700 [Chloroflexi bacterium]|nr:hypothetical protein [Chloroflexota bacterium]